MRVFQIGVAGGVGRRLARLLVERGDEVTGMFRDPAQSEAVADLGATPVVGDLINDSVDELAAKLAHHDAVVFSAGAHGTGRENTTLIDGRGLEKAADAARLAGVSRFVVVSVFPDANRAGERTDGFEHYMAVKKRADVYLAATDLDWIIVRPGTLTDGTGDGLVTAGPAIAYGDIRRDNLAAFIAETLHTDGASRVIVEVTDGSTPVGEAARATLVS